MMDFRKFGTAQLLAVGFGALGLGVAMPFGDAKADQVFNDDVIITFSLCVGSDCNNGEVFGFDTIKLKENNIRIKFDDTSSSASFPNNDWQLTANDSSNGGANKFSIDDITGGRTPFTIEASAPNNSLYVDDAGRVGIKTAAPVVDLHIVNGNSPTMRLEQNGSSGFTPQTWDVAGNEANFFVRDATNGSKLPFKIFPNAPTNALIVEGTTGDIGVGIQSPTAALHVLRSNGTAQILVEETSGTVATRGLGIFKNNGGVFLQLNDTDTGRIWNFQNQGNNALITNGVGAGNEFTLSTDGDLTITGTLTTAGSCSVGCDRVFDADYDMPSIEKHAEVMWTKRHLPAVGPTREGEPMNLTTKLEGVLNELEKAHIYIEQLNKQNIDMRDQMASMQGRLSLLASSDGIVSAR